MVGFRALRFRALRFRAGRAGRVGRAWLLTACLLLLGSGTLPVAAQPAEQCFEATGFCISGRMLAFWQQNGSSFIFGLPISPLQTAEIEGQTLQVQWFERARLELHPDNAPPYDVLVSRLGADTVAAIGGSPAPEVPFDNAACQYFPETGFNVCDQFLLAWRANGVELDGLPGKTPAENLALFGLPLTGAYRATLADGREYLIQWFERARFELHPDNAPPNNVLYGLLGREWLTGDPATPAPTPNQPAPVPPPAPQPAREPTPAPPAPTLSGLIAFASTRDGNGEVYTMQPDGSNPRNVTNNPAYDANPAWSPDGTRIAFASNRDTGSGTVELYVMNTDGSGVTRLTTGGGDLPTWSPDGTRIAYQRGSDIIVMNADGTNLLNLTAGLGADLNLAPAWSPDGSRIAFSSNVEAAQGFDLEVYTIAPDGTNLTRLTSEPGDDIFPAWSPDGTRIAFLSSRAGNDEIFVMGADGSNPTNLTRNPGLDVLPAWSPTSDSIIFQSRRDGSTTFDIYRMLADGSGVVNLTNQPDRDNFAPVWRP